MIDYDALGERMAADHACAQCGSPFEKARSWARFCSAKCRTDWHEIHDGINGIVDTVIEGKRSVTVVINFASRHCAGAAKFKAGMAVKVSR